MADPRETAGKFARELEGLFGPRLRSVTLYGSVARGEAVPAVSDINLLVLLDHIDPASLQLASPLARRWIDAGNTAPLLMPWNEWQRAADAFAIEVADMRDAHEVILGDDPIDDLPRNPAALRLQTEHELRGKLVQLRTGLLIAAERPEEIGRLLLTALPSFATYFRALLRLVGRPAPASTEDAITQAAAVVGFDAAPLVEALRDRTHGTAARFPIDGPVTAGYYGAVARTIDYVDTIPETNEP